MVAGVLSRLWTDCCRVIVREPAQDGDGVSRFRETVLYEGLPCRLSYFYSRRSHAADAFGGAAAKAVQTVKLILPRDVQVPPGSRIQVKREDRTMDFCASGQPAIYSAHQEIVLENFGKWA